MLSIFLGDLIDNKSCSYNNRECYLHRLLQLLYMSLVVPKSLTEGTSRCVACVMCVVGRPKRIGHAMPFLLFFLLTRGVGGRRRADLANAVKWTGMRHASE